MAAKKSSPIKPSPKKNQTQVSPLEGNSIPLRLPPNLMASLRKIIKEAREEYYGHGIPDLEVVSCILREGKPEMNPENLLAHFKRKFSCSNVDLMDTFGVDKYKVAGSTATLVRRGYIRNLGSDPDGVTHFVLLDVS